MDKDTEEVGPDNYYWGEFQSSSDESDEPNKSQNQNEPNQAESNQNANSANDKNDDDYYYYYYDDDDLYYSDDEPPETDKKVTPTISPTSNEFKSQAKKSIEDLPNYKPKNTGKGFSSSSSSDDENAKLPPTSEYYSDESDIERKSVTKNDKPKIIPESPKTPDTPSKIEKSLPQSPDNRKRSMKHFNRRRSSNFRNKQSEDSQPNSPDIKSKSPRRKSVQTRPDGNNSSKYTRRRSRGSPKSILFNDEDKKSPVKSILEEKVETSPKTQPVPTTSNENETDDNIDIESVDPKIRDILLKYKSENQKLSKENKALNIRLKRLKNQSPSPSQENLIPVQLAPFDYFKNIELKKICVLGRGATSKVTEVEDVKTGKRYAKKVLFKEFLNVDGIKHFIAEFELLQYLSHPCTAKVYGFDMDLANTHNPASIYFEVLQISLSQAIDASTNLSRSLEHSVSENITLNAANDEAEKQMNLEMAVSSGNKLFTNSFRARSLLEICCGMEYVHDCGIIHRDLKADNILLNETLNAKICDFGIAQLQNAEKLTKNVGTLFYMSPEMLAEKNYGKETDVYSFGILAYFVFTGIIPKITLTKKVSGESVPEIPDFVTPLAKEIITKCCAFEPSQRPTFTEVIELMRQNDFKLFSYCDNDFVKNRYGELMNFKKKHPAQLIQS